MAATRKKYTPEFKLAAVKMVTDEKLSVAEVARRLGVPVSRLHEWKKALATRGGDAFLGSGHLPSLGEELRRLRAGNKRLEAERDIPKKARRFSPPCRGDLRLGRGAPLGVAGNAFVPRLGRVALGLTRLARPRSQ